MASINTPSGEEQLISNYFVEVYPGEALGEKIAEAKAAFIELLGDEVIDNPLFARFFRDDPHFTMMCARTGNLPALHKALSEVATEFQDIPYEITGTEFEAKGGLLEFHTMVDEPTKELFAKIHSRVLEESIPHNTAGLYELFPPHAFASNPPAHQNLQEAGFPFSNVDERKLFNPHASIGRLHPNFINTNKIEIEGRRPEFDEMRPAIIDLIRKYESYFNGQYETAGMIVRQLPFNTEIDRQTALGGEDGGVVDNKATPYNPVRFSFGK